MAAGREQDYISEARQYATDVFHGIQELKRMQAEWNALDYGSTLDNGSGANAGYLATDVGAVVFATADALLTTLAAGHATNLAKLL